MGGTTSGSKYKAIAIALVQNDFGNLEISLAIIFLFQGGPTSYLYIGAVYTSTYIDLCMYVCMYVWCGVLLLWCGVLS
jgi:hypothetical protein